MIGISEHGNRELVERAAKLCPDGSRVVAGSNQSWTLAEAKEDLGALMDLAPHFANEALSANAQMADWEDLAAFTDIPLAGGENIYGSENFRLMAKAGMQLLQPDVAKWGGMTGALDLASSLPKDTPLWPHFMGTAVGQIAALSNSATKGKDSACEADVNGNALRTDLRGDVITVHDACASLPTEPGLVVSPLPDRLEAFADG